MCTLVVLYTSVAFRPKANGDCVKIPSSREWIGRVTGSQLLNPIKRLELLFTSGSTDIQKLKSGFRPNQGFQPTCQKSHS
jgi:hypothetical protein